MFRKNKQSNSQSKQSSLSFSDLTVSDSESSTEAMINQNETVRRANVHKSRKASDVINSFLNQNPTVRRISAPNSRKASDVINSFLQKNKIVDQANDSKFESALDVINSYLRKNEFGKMGTSSGTSNLRKKLREDTDDSTSSSESDFEVTSRKRRTEISVSSSTSSSESDADTATNVNAAKKPIIKNCSSAVGIKDKTKVAPRRSTRLANATSTGNPSVKSSQLEPEVTTDDSFTASSESSFEITPRKRMRKISKSTSTSATNVNVAKKPRFQNLCSGVIVTDTTDVGDRFTNATSTDNPSVNRPSQLEPEITNDGSSTSSDEEAPPRRTSAAKKTSSRKRKSKSKEQNSEFLKLSLTTEVSRGKRNGTKIEREALIRSYQIPKEKYDRAWELLNSTECRYDETPVYYSGPKPYDTRHNCNSRRHAEATYDISKLGTSFPISVTRIVFEMDNCLKKESWQQMAELIYFGCGLMNTVQSKSAIGTSFFTYALMLLILDSSPSSTSTFEGKKKEIMKFLTALGGDPDECEALLKELNFLTDDVDAIDTTLGIQTEEE